MRKRRRPSGKPCALRRMCTGYVDLANCPLALQRFNETRQIIRDAQARKLDDCTTPRRSVCSCLSRLATLPAMEEQQQWFASNPEYENLDLLSPLTPRHMGGIVPKRAN